MREDYLATEPKLVPADGISMRCTHEDLEGKRALCLPW
jgi:hypothetical protein